MKYYGGVTEYNGNRTLTITDDIDCQDCEVRSEPGIITVNETDRSSLYNLARALNCQLLEVNLTNQYYTQEVTQ